VNPLAIAAERDEAIDVGLGQRECFAPQFGADERSEVGWAIDLKRHGPTPRESSTAEPSPPAAAIAASPAAPDGSPLVGNAPSAVLPFDQSLRRNRQTLLDHHIAQFRCAVGEDGAHY
jgi:hypothetical protein